MVEKQTERVVERGLASAVGRTATVAWRGLAVAVTRMRCH